MSYCFVTSDTCPALIPSAGITGNPVIPLFVSVTALRGPRVERYLGRLIWNVPWSSREVNVEKKFVGVAWPS